ncbi:hypothetical protein LGH83_06345 [Lichenihabitans sp. PAMC28606]|uniref:hypothetical protein n=1 Tax=Lichenihabitans sp. PAMC28606 TaxID=2880932 RepID=UPI001D0BA7E9|nr:hypothetical protein [Lichenihabitans sp. PAMC28606]UDL95819.1 hypothetical protein LGH83_06345 [Lichenihabitans sp. PAMC28606]
MMRADLARSTAERGQASFDAGRKVLRGGDDQPWPADLAASFDTMPLEQQALLRSGARSDIEQRFGQNRNDLSALARLLRDENDINRGHMGTLFGDDAGKAMADALMREKTFANTNNRVAQNSAMTGRQGGSATVLLHHLSGFERALRTRFASVEHDHCCGGVGGGAHDRRRHARSGNRAVQVGATAERVERGLRRIVDAGHLSALLNPGVLQAEMRVAPRYRGQRGRPHSLRNSLPGEERSTRIGIDANGVRGQRHLLRADAPAQGQG